METEILFSYKNKRHFTAVGQIISSKLVLRSIYLMFTPRIIFWNEKVLHHICKATCDASIARAMTHRVYDQAYLHRNMSIQHSILVLIVLLLEVEAEVGRVLGT